MSLREKLLRPAGSPGKRHRESHSRAQRQEFLDAAARLGSVAAAARELGINRSTCQKWANAAGIRCQRLYTQADKDQFHAALDRTGTISAAAQELGLNISTARNWAAMVNPVVSNHRPARVVPNAPAQRHGSRVREDFLRVLRKVGSVSVAARELGLNQSTCANWARAAGMASVRARRPSQKQVDYLRLRGEGLRAGPGPIRLTPLVQGEHHE